MEDLNNLPETLPADFKFDETPETLPADFKFDSEAEKKILFQPLHRLVGKLGHPKPLLLEAVRFCRKRNRGLKKVRQRFFL